MSTTVTREQSERVETESPTGQEGTPDERTSSTRALGQLAWVTTGQTDIEGEEAMNAIFQEPVSPFTEAQRIMDAARELGRAMGSAQLLDLSQIAVHAASNLTQGALEGANAKGESMWLFQAAMLRSLAEQVRRELDNAATAARITGATWEEIGHAVGVSKSRAQQRYGGVDE